MCNIIISFFLPFCSVRLKKREGGSKGSGLSLNRLDKREIDENTASNNCLDFMVSNVDEIFTVRYDVFLL